MVASPAYAHLLVRDAELEASCPSDFEVAIEGGFGDGFPVVLCKKSVDAIVRAEGLFFFEFDGLVDNFPGKTPWCATVRTSLSCKRPKPAFEILVEFSPEG